jgi:thiamine biosynthesis lipoprotein
MSVPNTSFYAMGTRCSVVLPGIDEDVADEMFRHIRHEIARIEAKLSRFLEGSAISILNANAANVPVEVDEEVFDILSTCASYHQKTGGYFDITLGAANDLVLDESHRTVSFLSESMRIDLGGFGKGYALEKVNGLLDNYDVTHAFLTMGESSVLTRGHHPAGDHWKVGIKSHRHPDESIHVFEVNNGSVSTSDNTIQHHHVIDPFTGIPVDEHVSVSVYSPSAMQAEILSTACLVMPDDQLPEIVNRFPGITIVKTDYGDESVTNPCVRVVG